VPHPLPRLLSILALLCAPALAACGAGGLLDPFDAFRDIVQGGGGGGNSSGLPGSGSGTGMSAAEDAYAREVLRLVNVERANVGLGAVAWDDQLAAVAYGHSVDMQARGFFDHVNPSGQGPGERLVAAGVTGLLAWGENIAYGQPTPADVMATWMGSTGHRDNILNPGFTHLGVGVHAPGPIWWTQLFGTR
jgi:uncharacterized protein YkwD